jgi:hypothetical protein
MAALPESQQGDRPAYLAALRHVVSLARGDNGDRAAAHRAEVEERLGSSVAADFLIFALAGGAKRIGLVSIRSLEQLDRAERAGIPAAMAKVTALAEDMNAWNMQLPWTYIEEAARQLPRNAKTIDNGQLLTLARAGVCANHLELAYAASAAGLERGANEAQFLLLRARSLPQWYAERRAACASAAAELARQRRDMKLLDEAVELVKETGDLSLTAEQANLVLKREKSAPEFPSDRQPGPDYRDLRDQEPCMCPTCRLERGEIEDEDDDEDDSMDDLLDSLPIPPDMPPEIAKILLQETRKAVERGESLDSLLNRVFGPGTPRRSHRRKRRR